MLRRLSTFVIAVVLLPLAAKAQPLIDRVPDDAIVYVGWQGAQSMGEPYQGSHLKAIVDSTDWEDFFVRFLPEVFKKVGQNDRDAAKAAELFNAVAKPLWNHSGAFYFGGIDLTNPRRPNPKIAFYCDAGADAPALVKAIKDALANAPKGRNDPQIFVSENEGSVTVTIGQPAIEAKSLSTSPAYAALAKQGHKSPVSVVYVDGERALKLVDEIVAMDRNPQTKERWTSIREATGLDGFKRAICTSGFEGKEWSSYASIDAPQPRKGLLQFLDSKPITDDIVKTIPATAVMAAAGRFDFTRLLDGIRDGGASVDPEFAQNYGAVMGYIGGMIGVELPALVEPLGDQWAYFLDPSICGDSFLGTVVVNKLDDPAKAQELFTRAERGINRTLQRQLPPNVTVSFKQVKRGDVDIHYLATPFLTPSWAIDGGNWYFGLYPQVVSSAVAQARLKGPSILTNPAYVAVREKLGTNAASTIQYVDVPKLTAGTYPIWLMLSRYAGLGDIFGIDSPLMLLPPMHELMPHLSPAGAVSWSDEKGWYARSISSFPGATLLAGDPTSNIAVPAVLTSILLPSLNRARETANRVKSASNLRQIGMACLLYSNENKGKYPPDIGAMLLTQDVGMDVFISPRTRNEIPLDVRQADPPTQAEWLNVNSDYVYIGGGKRVTDVGPNEVLAHERPDGLDDGINILYGDGHVEFVTMDRAMEQINK